MSEVTSAAGYLDMDLLRFTTAGSVDDGKSTLIGRLLYDSKAIFEDQLEAVEKSSKSRGDENVNLALLTDGLRSEREQGITIDVAYRYFATPKRKFIIADTPGHIQYTRNGDRCVDGESRHLLVDARKGVIEQTCRHSFIANLLRIRTWWSYQQDGPGGLQRGGVHQYRRRPQALCFLFDNIVEVTDRHPHCSATTSSTSRKTRPGTGPDAALPSGDGVHRWMKPRGRALPLQWVIRPHSDKWHDFRVQGRIAGGVFKPVDSVKSCVRFRNNH